MKTTGIKKAAKFLLPLAFLGALGYYASVYLGVYSVIEKTDLRAVPVLIILSLLFSFSNGLVMRIVLRLFGVHLSLGRCVGITALTSVGNSLTTQGGTVGKAVYLKKRHDFSYPAFLASMSAVQILGFAVISVSGALISMLTDVIPEIWRMPVVSGFAFVGVASAALMVIPLDFRGGQGRISRVAANVADGWKTFRRDKGAILKICLLLFINFLLGALDQVVGFGAFSVKIGMAQALLLEAISVIAFAVKITPANLGVMEVAVASSSSILGVGFGEGLVVATSLRVVGMFTTFLTGGILGLLVLKDGGNISVEPDNREQQDKKC